MNDSINPYAAPSAPGHAPIKANVSNTPIPAGQGRRFLNFVIDYLVQFVLGFFVGIVIVLVGGNAGIAILDQTPGIVFGIPIVLFYYFVCEATTSRTLGKLITGTKVVNHRGGKPSIGQIVGRCFCRLIPFEAFSFLGKTTVGWHDQLPKTYVVRCR